MGTRPTRRGAGALLLALAVGCASTGGGAADGPSPSPAPTRIAVTYNGFGVTTAAGTTVRTLAAAMGVRRLDGRLLSALGDRVLDARADPARITVGGTAAGPDAVLADGDLVAVVPGRDRTEDTETVAVPVPADPTGGGLYVDGSPGLAEVVRGTVSGEQVSYRLVRAPTLGRLRAPGTLALTFDDGPDPVYTPRVLALLATYRVKATFCLIGREATQHPAVVRAEVRAGHGLCDHTQSHLLTLATGPAATVRAEVDGGYRAVVAASGGVAPAYFRAPGGNWSAAIEAAARAAGMTLLRWSVDPQDWARPGAATIVARVLRQARPGGTVLMHDGGGNRQQTVDALAVLLPQLLRAGYRLVLPPRERPAAPAVAPTAPASERAMAAWSVPR